MLHQTDLISYLNDSGDRDFLPQLDQGQVVVDLGLLEQGVRYKPADPDVDFMRILVVVDQVGGPQPDHLSLDLPAVGGSHHPLGGNQAAAAEPVKFP